MPTTSTRIRIRLRSRSFRTTAFARDTSRPSSIADRGRSEWKAGVESDNIFLHENYQLLITDPTQFDDGTPLTFAFAAQRPDLEQSAFVEDLVHLGQLVVERRLAVGPLSASAEQTGCRAALCRLPLFPIRRIRFCISPTTASFKRHRLRTSSSPVPRRLIPLIPQPFCACRFSLPWETTLKAG